MMPPKKKKREFSTEVLKYLELNFHLPADKTADCCLNGHAILLYAQSGRLLTRAVKKINMLFEVKATYEHVRNLVKKSKSLAVNYSGPVDGQQFEDFCKESFMTSNNFNVIPLNGYREYLASNFTLPTEENPSAISCLNGHALHLYYNENPSVTDTSRRINTLFGLSLRNDQIRRLLLQTKNMLRSFKRERQNFEILCNEPLVCSPKPAITIITSKPSSPTHLSESTQREDLAQPSTSRDPTAEAYIEPSSTIVSVGTNTGEDLLRLSRENLNSREIELKNRLSNLSQRISIASKKNRSKVAQLKSKLKDMPQKIKVLNQKVKRKTVAIKALREKIHELQKNENRKKIRYLKVKKYSSDWKIKHSDQMHSNQVVITCTEKKNPLEEKKEQPQTEEGSITSIACQLK